MDCNSINYELKFAGSNAAEFALHLSLRNSGANFMLTIWGNELKHVAEMSSSNASEFEPGLAMRQI